MSRPPKKASAKRNIVGARDGEVAVLEQAQVEQRVLRLKL